MNSTEHRAHSRDRTALKIMDISLRKFETLMELPSGYITGLCDERSDFDFMIRLGLVMEATVTRAIALESKFDLRPEYDDEYTKLANKSQSYRVQLARELGLIDESDASLLREVALLRNAYVHDLKNLARPVWDYVESKGAERSSALELVILGAGMHGTLVGDDARKQAQRGLRSDFRGSLMLALFPVLLDLAYGDEAKRRKERHAAWRADQAIAAGVPLPPQTGMYLEDMIAVTEFVDATRAGRGLQPSIG